MADPTRTPEHALRQALERERALREELERRTQALATVLSSTPDLMYVFDRAGRYTYASLAGARALGRHPSELVGKTWHQLGFPPETTPPFAAEAKTVFATEQPVSGEIRFPTPDGLRDYEYILTPVSTSGGAAGAVLATLRDITGRKQAEAERERLLLVLEQERQRAEALAVQAEHLAAERGQHLERLQELDRLKDQFIALAAHELKTPVAIVKGYAQALLRHGDQVAPPGHRMLEAIDRGANRVAAIVQELLDVAKLEAGRLELEMERIDLTALVAEAGDRIALTTERHRIRLLKAAPVVVHGDRERLREVLADLVDNAVKYSPYGGDIDLAVEARDREAVVSVADRGVGIPNQKQGPIFQRFYSAHTSTPYDYGGMAVGLYLAKEIVARHGGRMWFESTEGRGTTFYFTLPLPEPERDRDASP